MKHIYTARWDLDDLSSALKIKKDNTLRFLRDGRNAAFLLKFYLSKITRMSLVEGHNAPTQLIDDDGGVWVIKTCTEISGISFCQNSMIGKGRRFNAVDFLKILKTYKGFLVCDVSAFPEAPIYEITSAKIKELYDHGALQDGRMKYAVFKNIVNAEKKDAQ